MAGATSDQDLILALLGQADPNKDGTIEFWVFVELLTKVGLSIRDIGRLLDVACVTLGCPVKYGNFVQYLLGAEPLLRKTTSRMSSKQPSIEGIADSLVDISSNIAAKDAVASSTLREHAQSLRRISMPDQAPMVARSISKSTMVNNDTLIGHASLDGALTHLTAPIDDEHDQMLKLLKHRYEPHVLSEEEACFRGKASEVIQKTGPRGSVVDDLVEVPIKEVKDKLAISYWRFCSGLRCWKSESVTEALKLICSAHVPGLQDVTYLKIFEKIAKSTISDGWESHVYLFGGLVRDILLRTVGNDIDIGFSAPAVELERICKKNGYSCQLDGDYILIGDQNSEEYLEGMVISYNGIQPSYHADFSMNTLFYDFNNEIIIDKTGIGIPAIRSNLCDLPCLRHQWDDWVNVNGCRVFFRLFKFLLRGYAYDDEQMTFVAGSLLDCWSREPDHTVEIGRIALGNLVGTQDNKKVEQLRDLVYRSFDLAMQPDNNVFPSADVWWKDGWLQLLKLS